MRRFPVFVVLLIFCKTAEAREAGFVSNKYEDVLELERQLKVLNKPPITSFKEDGTSTIDCIEIDKQPAFDHPLLRNHSIQMRPTALPKGGLLQQQKFMTSRSAARRGVDCPPKTVPIRRTSKEDLIRSRSLRPQPHSFVSKTNQQRHYFATVGTIIGPQEYYGATASVNIYNETVSSNQYSGAGIWLGNSINRQQNGIHYGWTVNPTLYGDHFTRTVGFWTTSNGNQAQGCFNHLCPGFVQVNSRHPLGDQITRQSVYGGEQFTMMALISKDVQTGNWWVVENMDDEGQVPIGYWPASLFTSLAESASEVRFGGEVYSPENEPLLPSMGSGHFEPPDFTKTSYVGHIQLVDAHNRPYNPDKIDISSFTDLPACYGLEYLGYSGPSEEYSLLFGGPGGSSCN